MGSQRVGHNGVAFTTHNKSTEHTKAKSVHTNIGVFHTAPSQGECSVQKTWTDPALPERQNNNSNKETRQTAMNKEKETRPRLGPSCDSQLVSLVAGYLCRQWGKDSVPMMAQGKISKLTWNRLRPPLLQPQEQPSNADWACGPEWQTAIPDHADILFCLNWIYC